MFLETTDASVGLLIIIFPSHFMLCKLWSWNSVIRYIKNHWPTSLVVSLHILGPKRMLAAGLWKNWRNCWWIYQLKMILVSVCNLYFMCTSISRVSMFAFFNYFCVNYEVQNRYKFFINDKSLVMNIVQNLKFNFAKILHYFRVPCMKHNVISYFIVLL
jgi:hypothetical protein